MAKAELSQRTASPDSRELLPRMELLAMTMRCVTEQSAIAGYKEIQRLHASLNGKPLDKATLEKNKVEIDQAATDAMVEALSLQRHFRVRSVWSEGAKEKDKVGKEAPRVIGEHGTEDGFPIDKASDPIEGTTAAAKNRDFVTSVAAVTIRGGILTNDGVGGHYMDKLAAPPRARGRLSLANKPEENLEELQSLYGISAKDITVVLLNRPRNQTYIDAVNRFGATMRLIEAGDLMPGVLAVVDPNTHDRGIHVLMGSGGIEEGVITAVAAKAAGGFMEGRRYDDDAKKMAENPILTLDNHLVTGPRGLSVFSGSVVNRDNWFGIDGIKKKEDGSHIVNTLMVTPQGWRVVTSQWHK